MMNIQLGIYLVLIWGLLELILMNLKEFLYQGTPHTYQDKG